MALQHLFLTHLDGTSPLVLLSAVAALILVLCFFKRVLYPTYDPREPPALRPKIPFVGHAFSIVQEGGGYFERLFKSTRMPICTMPVFGDKLYVLNSPALISAALRCPNLSFDPFIVVFSQNALAVSKEDMRRLRDPEYIHSAKKPFYPSMSGEPLRGVVRAALGKIAGELDGLGRRGGGGVCEVPHIGDWLRDVMSQAIMDALYGSRNPITLERLDDVWWVPVVTHGWFQDGLFQELTPAAREFDRKITILTLGLAPRLLAPTAVAARGRIQATLHDYYLARHDQGPDVSAFVKNRAAAKREMGASASDLASGETDIPWASLINTIPTLTWVFVNVFSQPKYAERVRQEAFEATSLQADGATVDVEQLTKKPFMGACVQEVLRLYNKLCGYRHILEDTVLRDTDGREYLLKKGSNAQWPHGVPHLDEDVWGPDARVFNPDRFIETPAEEEKRRRGALIPFGGGKHLCPGRRFAVAEIACMVGAIALVFEVEGVTVPAARAGYAGCAMAHPAWESGHAPRMRVRRRDGWENVRLRFSVCGR